MAEKERKKKKQKNKIRIVFQTIWSKKYNILKKLVKKKLASISSGNVSTKVKRFSVLY